MVLDREVEDVGARVRADLSRAEQRVRIAVGDSRSLEHTRGNGRCLRELDLCLGEAVRVGVVRGVLNAADRRREVSLLRRHGRRRLVDSRLPLSQSHSGSRQQHEGAQHDPLPPQQEARVVPDGQLRPQIVGQRALPSTLPTSTADYSDANCRLLPNFNGRAPILSCGLAPTPVLHRTLASF